MKKVTNTTLALTADYRQFIEELKGRVQSARIAAARAITHEAWDIGRGIVEKQKAPGWGESVVEMVAADLQRAFPEAKGFSPQNIWRMQQLYFLHNQPEFLAQVVRELEKDGKVAPVGENLSYGFCFVGRQHRVALAERLYLIHSEFGAERAESLHRDLGSDCVFANSGQSGTLATLRDTLLSKLLRWKLSAAGASASVEASA